MRQVNDHQGEHSSLTAAAAVVVKQLGVGKESVRRWVIQSQVDGGHRAGASTEELAEIKALTAMIRRLEEDNAILKSATVSSPGTRPPQPLIMGFIDTLRSQGHAVESICRVLREQGCQVAARTYRSWKQARRVDAVRNIAWTTKVDPEGVAR